MNQNIEQAKAGHSYLRELDLADNNLENESLDVDILIGADYYWDFMNNHMKRSVKGCPTAISTKLGYVLSGPVINSSEKQNSSVNVINTHVLKIQSEVIDENHDKVYKLFIQNRVKEIRNLCGESSMV